MDLNNKNVLDLLTFTQLMKTFAVNPEGIQVNSLAGAFENVNQNSLPHPVEEVVNALIDSGYVRRILNSSDSDIIYNESAMVYIQAIRSRVKLEPTVEVSPKPRQKFSKDVSDIPLLKIPKAIRDNLTSPVPIIIQVIRYPRRVAFQLADDEHSGALDKFMEEFAAFYKSDERLQCTIDNREYIGNPDVIAAPYSNLGYFRAMILRRLSRQSFEVLYIDYGNTDICDRSQLFYLKREFMQLPPQAIFGCIGSLKDIKELPNEAVCKLQALESLSATFHSELDENDTYWPIDLEMEIIDAKSPKTLKQIVEPFISLL